MQCQRLATLAHSVLGCLLAEHAEDQFARLGDEKGTLTRGRARVRLGRLHRTAHNGNRKCAVPIFHLDRAHWLRVRTRCAARESCLVSNQLLIVSFLIDGSPLNPWGALLIAQGAPRFARRLAWLAAMHGREPESPRSDRALRFRDHLARSVLGEGRTLGHRPARFFLFLYLFHILLLYLSHILCLVVDR
eukprot:scaffold166358_cov23-Tisochrysis_lutea.AAC.2